MLLRYLFFVSLSVSSNFCLQKTKSIPFLEQMCKEIVHNLITLISLTSQTTSTTPQTDYAFFTAYQNTPAALKEVETFFKYADAPTIAHYQPYFALLIRKDPSIALILLNTLQERTDTTIKKNLIQALIAYANMPYDGEIPGLRDSIITKLLSLSLPVEEKTDMHQTMDALFSDADNIRGLQFLWLALMQKDDATLLSNSILNYYKVQVPIEPNFSPKMPLIYIWLSEVISYAVLNNTISRERIIKSIEEAYTTNLLPYIHREIIHSVLDHVIFNELMPLARRAKFLDFKIEALAQEDAIAAYYALLEHKIPDREFSEYVSNFFNACNKQTTSYEKCIAKKQLMHAHQKYGMPPTLPGFVIKYAGELPNFGITQGKEVNDHYRLLASDKLHNVQIDGQGFVYGFRIHDHERGYHVFCVADEESLDMVWEVACASDTPPLFVVYKSYVYLAYDSEIAILNKATGEKIGYYVPKPQAPIVHIQVTATGRLWVIQQDAHRRTFYSYAECGRRKIESFEAKGNHSLQHVYFTVNNKLGYYHDGAITFLEENGSTQSFQVNYGTHPTWCHNPACATYGNILYYALKEKDNACYLVCYETQQNKELWSLATGEISTPCIVAHGILYLVTNEYLMAIEIGGKILWQTPLPRAQALQYHSLALSPDNRYLSLQYMHGPLYSVNLADGSMKEIYTPHDDLHRRHQLVGVTNKNVTFITCDD